MVRRLNRACLIESRMYLKTLLATLPEAKGGYVIMTFLKAITAAAFISVSTLSIAPPAVAGWGCGWGCGWGAALAGFGLGATVGSAFAPVYVVPPPPEFYYSYGPADYEDYYYGPADYGPSDYGPPPRPPSRHGTQPSPRSKLPPTAATLQTSKTSGFTSSQQKIEAKFKAAQAKAKRAGVDSLTQADIEGLSLQQLKQIRGY
jgi:hypothetical protein